VSAKNPLNRKLESLPTYRVYNWLVKFGELAKATGVKIGTIRFYERRRLLKPAQRTASGYRIYTDHDVQAIKGIRLTQELGFTLKEIRELLELHRTAARLSQPVVDRSGMRQAMAMTEEKLRVLDHKAREIDRMRRDVVQILKTLRTAAGNACPFSTRKASTK